MPELETRIREWKRSLAIAFGGPLLLWASTSNVTARILLLM